MADAQIARNDAGKAADGRADDDGEEWRRDMGKRQKQRGRRGRETAQKKAALDAEIEQARPEDHRRGKAGEGDRRGNLGDVTEMAHGIERAEQKTGEHRSRLRL